MLKIKKLRLKNYAGFRDTEFDFTRTDGTFKPICLFFGPNGCGKSTGLRAIEMLGQAKQFIGRENDLVFRKMTYHTDYDPTLPHFAEYQEEMTIEGVFDLDGVEKLVVITSKGVETNELEGFRNAIWINADDQMNMKKFQIPADRIDLFLAMAEAIYGYPVSIGKGVETFEKGWDGRKDTYEKFTDGSIGGERITFYQDFVLDKGSEKVHFKSMSDGERKIATLLRSLCDPAMMDRSDIVLIDNVEMHAYMERHAPMILKLIECFPTKQFIVTSHSPILVGVDLPLLGIQCPSFVGKRFGNDCLIDVAMLKGLQFKA
jgi:predicted ATPase